MSGNPQNGQRHQLLSSWFVVTRRNMRVTGLNAMSVVKNFVRDITWRVIWQLIKTDIAPVDMTGLLIFYQCHGFWPILFRVRCRFSPIISKGHMTGHQDSHCTTSIDMTGVLWYYWLRKYLSYKLSFFSKYICWKILRPLDLTIQNKVMRNFNLHLDFWKSRS